MSALTLISQQFSNGPAQSVSANHTGKAGQETANGIKPFGDDGFTFADLIDIVNPLQHIPILSTIYRKISGDTIDPAARVAGGVLFGGAIGAVFAVAGAAFEKINDGAESPLIEDGIDAVSPAAEAIVDVRTAPANIDGSKQPSSPNDKVSIRGGWIVNAAYAGKSSALFGWARDPASEYKIPLLVTAEPGNDNARQNTVSVNI